MSYFPNRYGFVSTANSTTATLTSGATFTGTAEEVLQYGSITLAVIASHASATDGLSMQQSSDGTNWDITDVYTIPAATGKTFGVQVTARYFRVVYTNGGTGQSSFRLQTTYHKSDRTASVRPQDARSNDNDFNEVMAYGALFNGTSWDRMRGDITNGLDVDITRVPTDPFGANADAASATGSISAKLRFIASTGIPVTGTVTVGSHAVTNAGTFAVQVDGNALTSLQLMDDVVFTDDAAFTVGTSKIQGIGLIADETATDSIDEGDIGAPRMTLDRKQITVNYAHTTGGWTPYKLISAASTNATSVKGSAGQIGYIHVINLNAAVRYLKIYNKATAPTVGTDTPVHTFAIPASTTGAGFVLAPTPGIDLTTGIAFAFTTAAADADTGAVAANEIILNMGYK